MLAVLSHRERFLEFLFLCAIVNHTLKHIEYKGKQFQFYLYLC